MFGCMILCYISTHIITVMFAELLTHLLLLLLFTPLFQRQIELYNTGGKIVEVSKKDVKDEKSKEIYGNDGILASMLEEQGVS